jgi:membrane-bound inhibitor of C-type lysozyme
MAMAAASVDSTLTYRCGGRRVVLTQRGDKWQLNAGDQSVALRPVAAASGARYVGVSDDRSTFWSKGGRASVVVAGQAYPECALMTPARSFRAAE